MLGKKKNEAAAKEVTHVESVHAPVEISPG